MSQGPTAPEYGVVVPTLAAGVSCHAGSPIAIENVGGVGYGYLGNKHTGNTLVCGLATEPAVAGAAVPVMTLGLLTLTEAQWNEVAYSGGAAPTTGLVPGAIYSMYTSGLLNTGSGSYSVGDLIWNVGIALSATTMLISPFPVYKSN